eukprot:333958-Chlamydomonas_euryale.AAC.3
MQPCRAIEALHADRLGGSRAHTVTQLGIRLAWAACLCVPGLHLGLHDVVQHTGRRRAVSGCVAQGGLGAAAIAWRTQSARTGP